MANAKRFDDHYEDPHSARGFGGSVMSLKDIQGNAAQVILRLSAEVVRLQSLGLRDITFVVDFGEPDEARLRFKGRLEDPLAESYDEHLWKRPYV